MEEKIQTLAEYLSDLAEKYQFTEDEAETLQDMIEDEDATYEDINEEPEPTDEEPTNE